MKTRFAFVLVCVWLAGCGNGSGDDGGGGGGVDSNPMPMADARTDSGPMVCNPADPDSCVGETICVGTMCEPAFNRIYRFSGIAVTVASLDPDGAAWDPLGGAPDPYVELQLNGTSILITSIANNVFQATYGETLDKEIIGGSTLRAIVSDSDVGTADAIMECSVTLTADMLRHKILSCFGADTTAGSSIEVHFDVKG